MHACVKRALLHGKRFFPRWILPPRLRSECDARVQLVPINKQYPLAALMEACRLYPSVKHNRTLTFECVVYKLKRSLKHRSLLSCWSSYRNRYVMLDSVNDSVRDAQQLGQLLSGEWWGRRHCEI